MGIEQRSLEDTGLSKTSIDVICGVREAVCIDPDEAVMAKANLIAYSARALQEIAGNDTIPFSILVVISEPRLSEIRYLVEKELKDDSSALSRILFFTEWGSRIRGIPTAMHIVDQDLIEIISPRDGIFDSRLNIGMNTFRNHYPDRPIPLGLRIYV